MKKDSRIPIGIITKEKLNIFIPGTPRPQPRGRHGRGGHIYSNSSSTIKEWKSILNDYFLMTRLSGFQTISTACVVDALFLFKNTKDKKYYEGQPHKCKPDRDNLDKAVLDCMVKSGILQDDCLAFDGRITKLYTNGKTGVVITIKTVNHVFKLSKMKSPKYIL